MSSNPEIAVEDDEIASLLDELEAEIGGTPAPAYAPKAAAKPAKPEPVVVAEPEPEPEPEPMPEPVKPKAVEKARRVVEVEVSAPEEPEQEPELVAPADRPTTGADSASKLKYYVDVAEFNRDTKLTEATLDSAMMEQSGLRAFYGTQAAYAEAQHARLKVRFDVLEAKLYDEVRKSLAASGEKVTEKMVENAVKLDPLWIKGKNAIIEADTIASVNKSLVISLADRRDMMIQLGADRREEYKGAARVMEAKHEADNLSARAKAAFQNGRAN